MKRLKNIIGNPVKDDTVITMDDEIGPFFSSSQNAMVEGKPS